MIYAMGNLKFISFIGSGIEFLNHIKAPAKTCLSSNYKNCVRRVVLGAKSDPI